MYKNPQQLQYPQTSLIEPHTHTVLIPYSIEQIVSSAENYHHKFN